MDEVDAVRRRRPKDSFQNELHAKLRQRKSLGLSADITDSEEEVLASPRNMDFMKSRAARPTSAKRRADQTSGFGQGLGTTTMRARDLSSLLGRDHDDDDDEEIVQANLGKYGSTSGRLPSPGMKTPSPQLEYMRKTPTLGGSPKEQSGKLDYLYGGRKTPVKDTSPRTATLSKEDIIFGRKTPSDERRSPSDGSKTRLPGMESDRPWQPPNFRSASPGLSEHSRGSRGVTPVDGALDTISETPREKFDRKSPYGLKKDSSPRELSFGDRPKPQARSKVSDAKTPPLLDPRRKSPASPVEMQSTLKRSTPTLDLFGGQSRGQASQDLESYIEKDKRKQFDRRDLDGRKTPDAKQMYGRDKTPERSEQPLGRGGSSPTGRFSKDGRKTPSEQPTGDSKRSFMGRKTPTDQLRKTPTEQLRKTPTDQLRKMPTDQRGKSSYDQKRPGFDDKEPAPRQAKPGASLLDFLTEDVSSNRPKPQERKYRQQSQGSEDELDALLKANRQALRQKEPSPERQRVAGKSPVARERRMPVRPKSPSAVAPEGTQAPMEAKQQRPEDTSSLCEEIPPDPNRKVAKEAEKQAKAGKQTTERAQADNIINTIADAQGMQYIQPAKKMRPVTAEAKVQHRPKPRYGLLPGQKKPLEEREFNSTTDIRDAIYEEWYKDRQRSARKKKMEEEEKKRKKEEDEERKKKEKQSESQASYNAWMKTKKELSIEQKRKDEEKKKLQLEKEQEERANKDSGSYEAWRKSKEEQIKREKRVKAEEQRAKLEEEEWQKKKKEEERKSAHQSWVQKKSKTLKEEKVKKKEEWQRKRDTELDQQEQLRRKEQESRARYEDWIEKKELSKRRERKLSKQRSLIEEDNPKPAWYPSNRTIPFGR